MDGDIFGPYSAKGMMELDILPDLLVTENSIDTWKLASEFDFVALAKEEMLERLKNTAPKNEPSPETIIMEKRAALKKRLSNANSNMHKLVEVQECISKDSLFPSQIEFNANFNEGINSIGGKIIITPTQLIFHAHKLNFGNLSDRIFEIRDICGYEKGVLSFMYIQFINGHKIKLTVWNKTKIINELEARRNQLIKQ